ncbi:N-formylglutamate amidohydrolase [Falsiroseomonas selenitidurans]|uniref:N-formylglutamate amidohydrolase n=1 Tax=Falsiroseomonas selenitidurans TaxID=2716335 RepID=A0ABX1ECD9_9PROT|nr:N-formylglutamate amidohydrolase [Falsiroseomonas selenitidurans]NKC33172.1 N-formylglutamate amidohydrolase [Falsiroseomonas selenitidurans]
MKSRAEPDPPAASLVNPGGAAPLLLVCEHASNHIPARYHALGLPPAALQRHIAWDIGAAALAGRLAALLDAPLVLSGYSRLLIDCNRPPGVPSSIPARSEATDIPGNQALPAAAAAEREALFFTPFQQQVAAMLPGRRWLLGVHSFTPVFLGAARPWQAGVLYGAATDFGAALIAGLRADPALTVGDNEPYRIEPEMDFTVPVHGDARGIPAALIEVRQDLLGSPAGIESWALRLAGVIRPLLR